MTKFIKLTERYGDRDNSIVINCDCISALKTGNGKTDTMIQMKNPTEDSKNKYYFVKETVEEIWEMLNTAPIMLKYEAKDKLTN